MSFKSMRTVGIACLLLAILLPLAATMSLSPTSSGQAKCSDFVSCGSCATQPGCGWCAYLFTCLPGTVNGSTSGSCTEEWTVWMYQPSECPAQSPFPSLCTSKPCSDCVAADYCGWCGSTCVPGTASSPYYGTCSGWYFDHCPVVLARNVWWLWALFAFLLLSMLLTVRNREFRLSSFACSFFTFPIAHCCLRILISAFIL